MLKNKQNNKKAWKCRDARLVRPLIAGHVLEKAILLIKLKIQIIICKPVN